MTVRLAACGPRRRIQGLIWAGWTGRQLAAMSGLTEQAISRLALGVSTTVAPATARAVEDLYDRAWQGPRRPSTASRRRAVTAGWAPPLAWDDDTIDDPDASPAGARRPGERRDLHAYEDLLDIGCTADEIAAHLGVSQMRARNTIQTRTRRAAA